MVKLTKHQFKICEAVALGLSHYYIGVNYKKEVTAEDRAAAELIIPKLQKGWMGMGCKMPWSCVNKKNRKARKK